MYTYVQRPGCKKVNTATYVHTGGVSNAYSRVRMAKARVHGWVGTEKQRRRGHREGLDGIANGNEAWRTAERRKRPCVRPATFETGSCSSGGVWRTAKRRKRTSYGRNEGPVHREGCGVQQNGGNRLVLERYGRNGG